MYFTYFKKHIIFCTVLLTFFCSFNIEAAEFEQQKCFEYVFGDKVKLDPVIVKKVAADLSGGRHYIDTNGDGKPEEVWFIDTDPRHTKEKGPILVRAIDRDGDLEMGGQPDMDSDLYVVDWNADGTVDAVIGYEDMDGDQDIDRMGIFFFDKNYGLRVWWSRDDGDDNLLWYNVDYAYYQNLCEFHTNFGGDETFDLLYIKPGDKQWTPFSENPFCFFDRDVDGLSEETIRVVGDGNTIRSIRWSFDVDNDATKESPRDYDVSLTALIGKGKSDVDNENIPDSPLAYGDDVCETIRIEGFPAKIMKRNSMIPFLQKQIWSSEIMTWDENDLNIPYRVPGYIIERWEGVIASESKEPGAEMPRIGWPDCGPVNKRYEVVKHPKTINSYYYSQGDQRIHIKNSDKTWLKVDFNYDTKVDMIYQWIDDDKDGVVDKLMVDVNGDGKWDDSWKLNTANDKTLQWNFDDLHSAYGGVVALEPQRLYSLNKLLAEALKAKVKGAAEDDVWAMIENKMQCKDLTNDLSQRLLKSDETMLYYLRLSADRRIAHLKELYPNKSFWEQFAGFRGNGNTKAMYQLVAKQFGLSIPSDNEYNNWLSDLRKQPETRRVAWSNSWFAPNWGWESEKAAFRCYDGHFDLFGKRYDCLIMPTLTSEYTYHVDHGTWGMDILHVGQTGGCGGLVLFVDGVAYPVRHEKEGDPVYSARLVKETKDTVTIGFTVTGVGPKESPYTVYINASARAGQDDDLLEAKVEGGDPSQDIQLGIVINKLSTEQYFFDKNAGVMGSWGFQDPAMGWIGMGLIFPVDRYSHQADTPEEHRVVVNCKRGEWIKYYAQGDWLRAHFFVPGAGAKDWEKTLQLKASGYNLK